MRDAAGGNWFRPRASEHSFILPAMADQITPVAASKQPSSIKRMFWRSAGFGTGFAVAFILIIGSIYWWTTRPAKWSDEAIFAKEGSLGFQRRAEQIHLTLAYALTNNTNADYAIAQPGFGVLMRNVKETSSMAQIADAKWASPIIPPHQTVDVIFDITFELSDFGTNATEIERQAPGTHQDIPQPELDFMKKRLKDFNDGFTFMDYSAKYRIKLPPFTGADK